MRALKLGREGYHRDGVLKCTGWTLESNKETYEDHLEKWSHEYLKVTGVEGWMPQLRIEMEVGGMEIVGVDWRSPMYSIHQFRFAFHS